jgi:hypothetical protein
VVERLPSVCETMGLSSAPQLKKRVGVEFGHIHMHTSQGPRVKVNTGFLGEGVICVQTKKHQRLHQAARS